LLLLSALLHLLPLELAELFLLLISSLSWRLLPRHYLLILLPSLLGQLAALQALFRAASTTHAATASTHLHPAATAHLHSTASAAHLHSASAAATLSEQGF